MVFDSLPRVPQGSISLVQEDVFYLKPGVTPSTILFCVECQTKFFDGGIITSEQILSYTAAQQIASSHGLDLGHTVHRISPEREL